MLNTPIKGRFAPTPSGFLHLGNIFSMLLAYLYAKSNGGSIVLRIEDLDPQRCTRERADALAKDLEWLGLDWDEGAYANSDSHNYFQSQRSSIYDSYFTKLLQQDLIYPCFCTRNELHAASAPHLSDGLLLYNGACSRLTKQEQAIKLKLRKPSYRLRVNENPISFQDGHYGWQSYNLAADSGDFIIRRSDGIYAYQLAVVIDDALMGVNQVVRGWDLLSSTPRQLYLYKLLKLPTPTFTHIPLLTAPDGRRLAKRDGDTELRVLKEKIGSSQPIIGYLAFLAGQLAKPEPLTVQDIVKIFNPQKIPTENIVVTGEIPYNRIY